MWSLFYRNSRLLILTVCLIVLWGLSSFQFLPRMEDPNLTQRFAIITTSLPGASAKRIESLVTEPIEQALLEIEEIKTVRSFSEPDVSNLEVNLKDTVVRTEPVWSRIRDRLTDVSAQLPPEAGPPEFEEVEIRAYTQLVALSWNLPTSVNWAILRRLAEDLQNELYAISGTEKIELVGAPQEEIIVEVNPSYLAVLGLTPQELSQQIRQSDAKVAAGRLRSDRSNLQFEVDTALDSLERIRQIPIRSRRSEGDALDQIVPLGDVAVVEKGIENPLSSLALIDGQPAIVLALLMEPTQHIDRWSSATRQTLAQFQDKLPGGVTQKLIFDQSGYVKSRLDELFNNLLLGAVCVLGCTFVLMGWRSALVVGTALPLSVLMVFGGMRLLNIPLHQMSVTGLVIALGLLIDNAIVVVDEVQKFQRQGDRPQQAISRSVRYLAIPLLASTLTTVLAFLPVAVLPGDTGEFVRALALNVILALLSSLFLSLTIIPALSGLLDSAESESGAWWHVGFSYPPLTALYRRSLDWILAKPLWGVVLSLLLPVTGFVMAANLESQFFPPAERDQFHLELKLPSQAPLEQTRSVVLQANDLILRHAEVVNVHWFVGTTAPAFYYNLPRGGADEPNSAQGMVQITVPRESRTLIQTLQTELNEAFPAVRVLVRQLEQGPPTGSPIEMRIYGPDLEQLRELGEQARAALVQVPNVTYTQASLTEVLPTLNVQIDEEQARLAGLNNTEIAQQLNNNLEGTVGGSLLEDTEDLPVRVRLSEAKRDSLDQIASLELPLETGSDGVATTSLSALGEIELVPELATIHRRNGQRVNTVTAFIQAGVLPSTVLADFKQRLSLSLPTGYRVEFGGESAERGESVADLLSTAATVLVLMAATLVLSFGSFRSAGIIAIVGVCSVGLGLASLWLFSYPLGFMAILGTIGLVGVAINDSIVILTALRSHSLSRYGDLKTIREVIIGSTRHVLTTTVTTVAGFAPLLLSGSDIWAPLAVCMVVGIVGATLLALYFIPCAYLMSQRRISVQKKLPPLA